MTAAVDDSNAADFVVETLQRFAQHHLDPTAILARENDSTYPDDLLRLLLSPEIGLHLVFLPEQRGGLGCSTFESYRITVEMAGMDLSLATSFLAIGLGLDPLLVGGTEEQKDTWLGRFAADGLIVGYGVTEAQAGSEVGAITTNAEPVREEGVLVGYRLNGTKQFITNSGVADLYTILSLTPGGPSFFLVPNGTPGLSFGPPEDKHGIRTSRTGPVILEDVFVPVAQLVGGAEGLGLAQASKVFAYTRLMVAAMAVGVGRAALSHVVAYSKERVQFATPLAEKQGYTHKFLVPHTVRLDAVQAYIEDTCRKLDAGDEGLGTEGAVAKLYASEVANRLADDAIQALGGHGFMRELHVERLKRDVRVTTIYEGTSETLQGLISRERWRESRQSKFRNYADLAEELSALAGGRREHPAHIVALAAQALTATLPVVLAARLTLQQHLRFELAEMITYVEVAAAHARAVAAVGEADGGARLASARLFAREAAEFVFDRALRLVAGSGALKGSELRAFEAQIGRERLHDALVGSIDDMDLVASSIIRLGDET